MEEKKLFIPISVESKMKDYGTKFRYLIRWGLYNDEFTWETIEMLPDWFLNDFKKFFIDNK